jgi:cell division protein FtsB
MADTETPESTTPKVSAPKDKNCPFCGQAFTSSSLGRHLDLYIRDKNPKPPDGVHDVDSIKKMRGTITRRQPRGSLGGRQREGSTPSATPKGQFKKETSNPDSDSYKSPAIPKDGQYAVDSTLSKYPFAPRWEATGVMNDLPGKSAWDNDGTGHDGNKRPSMQRTVSKQMVQKAQFDVKQKLADAMDTARAAELGLRELISSWRAAKQHIDNNSMPFDFDPLSLDFPALTLQCLQPPPTLFSSTQHPTSTSWSVQSPGQREFVALKAHFQEEFRAWRVTCASATTAAMEELTYPPAESAYRDARDVLRKAEKSAEDLEKQVQEHLQSAYHVWDSLPAQRQTELWVLELARGVGRKQKETDKLKDQQHKLKQENANLKAQIDQLNRLQHPREFSMVAPSTIPIDRDLIAYACEMGLQGAKVVGFNMEDRHTDLSTLVSRVIERWKHVITSTRANSTGMSAQKPLEQESPTSNSTNANTPTQVPVQNQAPPPQPQLLQHQLQQQQQSSKRSSTASTNGQITDHSVSSTTMTRPPSIEETSDQDADAEMEDDDSFGMMNATAVKPLVHSAPIQQQANLEVPRTRGPMQQRGVPDPRFMMQNGAGSPVGRAAMNMTRSMPNMNMAMQGAQMHGADLGMAMQSVRGDSMYME